MRVARRGVLGLLATVGGVLAVGACGLLGGDRYRFRMTVAVDTPEGLRTGSSVYEVTAGRTGGILPEEAKRDWAVRGQAVAVDLPGGRTLFALLKTHAHFDDMMGLSMATLHPDFGGTGYDVVGVAKELARGAWPGPAEVAPEDYPMLVTFAEEDEPASVALVQPGNLSATFGRGVRLRGITVELTDDPVRRGIKERLGWLPNYYDKQLSGDRFQMLKNKDKGLSAFLSSGAFSADLDLYERGWSSQP